jgi:DNA repair exonuclease SbcCD ATPase subunit
LTELLLELNREKEKLDKHYKNYEPKCTKEDMLSALRLMQEIDTFISNIYTFNHDAVVETINHMLVNDNIDEIVKRQILSIDEKISKNNLKLLRMNNSIGAKDEIYVLYKPMDCNTENCPYIRFYNDHNDTQDTPTEKINNEIKKLEKKREYYLTLSDISKNIDYFLVLIKSNKNLIDKMPEDFFNIKHIFSCIQNCIPFYDENIITNYIAALEDFEKYVELKDKIKEVKKEITFIEKNATSLTSLRQELQNLDNEIDKTEREIKRLKNENENLTKRDDRLTEANKIYEEYKSLQEEIKGIKEETEAVLKSINIKKEIQIKINDSINIKNHHQSLIDKINIQIKNIENEINDNKFKLKEFEMLNSEKMELQNKYDDIYILKESLSTHNGIPILFIQLYFKNTRIIVNNLLESVFNGALEIENFEINDTEFRIPYTKNGIKISDVAYTSQGEKSFMSLALSFALIEQSIKKYNIMLLDEIDATLDQRNRAMFLNILEKQLEAINAEQVFMITHNNMFDSYPVDLIMTSDEEIDNYKNMNILYSATANK